MIENKAFYEKFAEMLEISPAKVNEGLVLKDTSWDSLAVMATIAMIDDIYNVTVPGKKLSQCQTAGDILALVQMETSKKADI
ncbi:phosphopantetheine-binding protein [Sporomusa acidovorans]|uniref:Carrier domain-containing protein n=1 Tax=Sporomusa acidovorans (strain ATCC 49682 / DSM 3132 / Mol) TaxID=1123286 RepID=A0ABZ3J7J6_SPOA4|nr:phosphopantetheine-binding protein [Sporomusa acidovorans]OZC19424.1 hypothetical protein SPACI_30140 [Sporomusa acidovorans DSM 3132]SDD76779.1 acyl carrier protein [Sporomusa acidovorans]